MSKKTVLNAALLIGSMAIAFAVAEAGLRGYRKMQHRYSAENAQKRAHGWIREKSQDAFDREGEFYGRWDEFAKMRYSAYLGYWPASGVTGNGYVTNAQGFRNVDDVAREKADGELRVFVTGGSTAWAAGVRQEDTYAVALEGMLRERLGNPNVHVFNAGVGAYLSTHERIVVTNKIARLEPDAVVHLSGWNDPYAGYRGYSVMDDRWDYTSSAAVLGTYHRLFVYDADSARMMDPGPPKPHEHGLATFYYLDQIYYAKRLEAARRPHQAVVDDFVENLRLAKAAVADDVPYVLALQPTLYATEKKLTEWEQLLVTKNEAATPAYGQYNARVYALYRAQLPDAMNALGITYTDTDGAIAPEPRSVFTDHVHFGDRGNRLLAERLAQVLEPVLKAR